MNKLTIDEAKKIELNILVDIDDYCRKNNLQYFLWGGTLLGSVRHHGFIPWDDDIDIVMPREDYDYFIHHYDNDRYGVQSCETNKLYPYWFAKAFDKRTKKVEPIAVSKKFDIGVDVDIFPIDLFCDKYKVEKTVEKRKCLKQTWRISIWKYTRAENLLKRIRRMTISSFRAILKSLGIAQPNRIARTINRIGKSFVGEANDYMLYADSNINKPLYLDKNIFSDVLKQPFEDYFFNIPSEYDALLTQIYGDYMTPPPPEKRVAHHLNSMYWRD